MEIIARSRNLYRIEGPAEIGVSGGRTSGMMLRNILDAHDGQLPPDVYALFENTGKEREETLIFIHEFEQRWGVPIYWIEYCRIWQRDDLPSYKFVNFETASRNSEPFNAMLAYYEAKRLSEGKPPYLPNYSNNMCSAYLKTKAAAWFMLERGYDHWDKILGIRYDEPYRYHSRMSANEMRKERWENVLPLYHERITKPTVHNYWQNQSFDLGIDSDEGNCDLCWKKKPEKIMRSITKDPWRADWWIATEDRTGQTFRSDRRSYRHMKFYAAQVANQIDMYDEDSGESLDCACTD